MPLLSVPSSPSHSPSRRRARPKPGRSLVHLASRVFDTPLCVEKNKLNTIIAALAPHFGLSDSPLPPLAHWDDVEDDEDEIPVIDENGVATIPVYGTLVARDFGMNSLSGMASYERLSNQLRAAMSDSAVKAVVLNFDSPGGEVDGMLETAEEIFSLRGAKPMVSVCNSMACSAAYCLASATDHISITQTGTTGSVGCYMVHRDESQRDAKVGLKYTYIQAGSRKTEGNPHEPLADRALSDMQAEVDRIRNLFVQAVVRNRRASLEAVYNTEGAVVFGPAAVPLFADRVGTLNEAVSALGSLPTRTTYSLPPAPAALKAVNLPQLIEARVGRVDSVQTIALDPGIVTLAAAVTASPTSRTVRMLCAPYGDVSIDLGGGMKEKYQRGCFSNLSDDLRILWQHEDKLVLGRTAAGTGRFWDQADGLYCEANVPETTFGDDVLTSLRAGNINQSSLSFWIVQSRMEVQGGSRVRVIERALIREASVVSWSAYPSTTAAIAPAASVAALRRRLDSMRTPATVADCRARIAQLRRS